jgi:hypothetical protein
MSAYMNLGNMLGYSFHPHKVKFLLGHDNDTVSLPETPENSKLSALLSNFLNHQNENTGWACQNPTDALELCELLKDKALKVANAFNKSFEDVGIAKTKVALQNGETGTLQVLPFAYGP